MVGVNAFCLARFTVKTPYLGNLLIGRALVMRCMVAAEHVDYVPCFLIGKMQVCGYIKCHEVALRVPIRCLLHIVPRREVVCKIVRRRKYTARAQHTGSD